MAANEPLRANLCDLCGKSYAKAASNMDEQDLQDLVAHGPLLVTGSHTDSRLFGRKVGRQNSTSVHSLQP